MKDILTVFDCIYSLYVRIRWAWLVACAWQRTGAYRVMMGKHEGERPLRRPRCRRQDNIETNLKEIGWV
jgi:hypothetical protein